MKIRKSHVWERIKLKQYPAYIEAAERKPLETSSIVVCVGVPLMCLLWIWVRPNPPKGGQMDWPLGVAFVLGTIGIAILILYRPPRILRLYPQERVAHTCRSFLGLRFLGRWHDLGNEPPELKQTGLVVERRQNAVADVFLVPLIFLGPLGFLLGLFIGGGSIPYSTFALIFPGTKPRPLAIFYWAGDGERVVKAFNQLAEKITS